MDNFTLTLPSNVISEYENRIGDYRTPLPRRIALDGDWEVALLEVTYPKTYYNLSKDSWIGMMREDGKFLNKNKYRKIAHGCYETVGDLITTVQEMFNTFTECSVVPQIYEDTAQHTCIIEPGRIVNPEDADQSNFDRLKTKTIIESKEAGMDESEMKRYKREVEQLVAERVDYETSDLTVYPIIVGELSELLGFFGTTHKLWISEFAHLIFSSFTYPIVGKRPIDLNRGISELYVYCDVVEPNIVGNTYAKLLKVAEIPNGLQFGDQVVLKYDKPIFVPVSKNEFDMIHINIKDGANQTIPFQFGRCICTLQFRRRWTK